MKPKLIALSLLFSLLISTTAGAVFTDYDSDSEFNDAIDYVYQYEIVEGYDDGSFKENQSINRAEFTKIVMNAAFAPEDIHGSDCFDDVSDEWYAEYVCTAQRYNIVSGYPDGTFKPGDEISFVEAAKILSVGFFFGIDEGTDIWYEPFVEDFALYRIIPASITELDKKITRGEMVEMIWRIMAVIEDRSYADYQNGQLIAMTATNEPVDYGDYEVFVYGGDENIQAEYLVEETESALLTSGTSTSRQEQIIEWIFSVFDDDVSDEHLGKIIFYDESSSDTSAYVLSNDVDTGKFGFYVNLAMDTYGDEEMVFTVIHEYAHVLSLNYSQDSGYVSEEYCETYYSDGLCFAEDAYLNVFYSEFWAPYPDSHGYNAEARYSENPGHFLNEYSATDPTEDFAESFAYYITQNSPTEILDKYDFFDSYSEFADFKSTIQSNVPEALVY